MASSQIEETADEDEIAARMLDWYDANARDLPWRMPPGRGGTPDPYRIWLSEIMLQQTTVAAVRGYFERFTARWPDIRALADAEQADVLAAWAGLGYYARARNLIACARIVAAGGGRFPDSEEALRALPGIGAYTAAAIAAIAFGRRAVVVDANIERVVARLFALCDPLPGVKPAIRTAMDRITPESRAGDFAQATMDLGAQICTPRNPRCPQCPLRSRCKGRAQGIAESLPIKPAKKPRPERRGTAFWIERVRAGTREVLLIERAGSGMLAGMRALPDDGWHAGGDGDGVPPLIGDWHRVETRVSHGFSHFSLTLSLAVLAEPAAQEFAPPGALWWPVERLEEAGLPTVFARAARLIAERSGTIPNARLP